MFFTKNKILTGFTLIELLVSITIISSLATIALVSTRGAITKARVSKGLQYDKSIYNGLGIEAVAIWSFDEGSGDTVFDGSGYGNNGVITGAAYISNTPHEVVGQGKGKYALEFDGTGSYVSFSQQILDGDFTISAWVYPRSLSESSPGPGIVIGCPTVGGNPGNNFIGLELDEIHFLASNSLSRVGRPGETKTGLTNNRWHHFVLSRNNFILTVFVDGEKKLSESEWNSVAHIFYPGLIGSYRYWDFFDGIIDEVKIYNQSLTSAQIKRYYVESAGRRGIAINN